MKYLKELDPAIRDKYPHRDSNDVPFRLVRTGENKWNVFEPVVEMDCGHGVRFHERQNDFDNCETLKQAVDYWSTRKV